MVFACRVHHNPLEHVSFGKPNPVVFKNAEAMLRQLQPSYHSDSSKESGDSGLQSFKTLYMIGDNPSVDIKGARQVCPDYTLVFIGGAHKISTIGFHRAHVENEKKIVWFHFQAGHPWFSILTRTGVFQGKHNHAEFPADLASRMMELLA